MLEAYSKTSFIFNGELIDTNWLEWEVRKPNGAENHHRKAAICKLRIVAQELMAGREFEYEDLIPQWLKEAK